MGTRGRCADGADVRERDDTRGDGGKRREKGFTVNDVPKLRLADMRKERMRAGWPNPPPLRLLLLLRQKTPYVGGSSRNTLWPRPSRFHNRQSPRGAVGCAPELMRTKPMQRRARRATEATSRSAAKSRYETRLLVQLHNQFRGFLRERKTALACREKDRRKRSELANQHEESGSTPSRSCREVPHRARDLAARFVSQRRRVPSINKKKPI